MQAAVANIAVDIYVDPTMRQRFKEIIERDGEVRNFEYQVRRHVRCPYLDFRKRPGRAQPARHGPLL